jgi:hypothetical protein
MLFLRTMKLLPCVWKFSHLNIAKTNLSTKIISVLKSKNIKIILEKIKNGKLHFLLLFQNSSHIRFGDSSLLPN